MHEPSDEECDAKNWELRLCGQEQDSRATEDSKISDWVIEDRRLLKTKGKVTKTKRLRQAN